MLDFSEKFMEDCFEEAPDRFIKGIASIEHRQRTIGGFRPDVLARDTNSRLCIIELQVKALDRVHLYKCLEYRDLIPDDEKSSGVRLILLCEELPIKYEPILKTHQIELVAINRADFVEIAARHCPESLAKHLALGAKAWKHLSDQADSFENRKPSALTPVDWNASASPASIYAALMVAMDRAGYTEKHMYPSQVELFRDLQHFVEHDRCPFHEAFRNPQYWDLERLLNANGDTVATALERPPGWPKFRRPRIELIPYLTSKRNLSVVWRPVEDAHCAPDFRYFPGDEALAYQRPENELLFVREAEHLRLYDPAKPSDWESEDRLHLNGHLLNLMIAIYQQLKSDLSQWCEVREVNAFEVDLYSDDEDDDNKNTRWFSIQRPKSWRIYSVEQRKRSEEEKWLNDFPQTYGVDVKTFLEAWRAATAVPRRSSNNAHKYLGKHGISISPSVAKNIVERLQREHAYLLDFEA